MIKREHGEFMKEGLLTQIPQEYKPQPFTHENEDGEPKREFYAWKENETPLKGAFIIVKIHQKGNEENILWAHASYGNFFDENVYTWDIYGTPSDKKWEIVVWAYMR